MLYSGITLSTFKIKRVIYYFVNDQHQHNVEACGVKKLQVFRGNLKPSYAYYPEDGECTVESNQNPTQW